MRIKILGRLSQEIYERAVSALEWTVNEDEILLFCDYSECTISIGHIFTSISDIGGNKLFKGMVVLNGVTQSFFLPFDEVPVGHKTICKFEISNGVPDCIKSLIQLDHWELNTHALWVE